MGWRKGSGGSDPRAHPVSTTRHATQKVITMGTNVSPEEQTARLVDGVAELVERLGNSPQGRKFPEMQRYVDEAKQKAKNVRRELGVD